MKYIKNLFINIAAYFKDNIIVVVVISLLLISFLYLSFPHIFVVVPPGFAGAIYRPLQGGVDENEVIGEGLTLVFPWNKIYQYDTRLQVKQIEMEVLTSDQLKSSVKLTFQFTINRATLPFLHKYIGPQYVQSIVVPEVIAKTREMFGKMTSTDAFTTELGMATSNIAIDADRFIINKLSPNGLTDFRLVTISAFQIDSISYPQEMQSAIQDKLIQQQNADSYKFRIQAANAEVERKVIEAAGIKKFQDIVNSGLTENYLRYKGIEATEKISESQNSKIIFIGSGNKGLPLIFGGDQKQ